MCKLLVLVILTIMFNPFYISFARAEWLRNGKPVFDSAYAKTDGDFGAMIIFTDKPSDLFNAWNKSGSGVEASLVEKVKKEETLVALIVFSNCYPDSKGMANVSVTFSLLDPAKNIIKKTDELEV